MERTGGEIERRKRGHKKRDKGVRREIEGIKRKDREG